MTGRDEETSNSTYLGYAAAPRHPWQLTFMVVMTLVCGGVLLVGMLMYGYRQVTGPQPSATRPAASAAAAP